MEDIESLNEIDYNKQSLNKIAESFFKETGTATKY